MEPLKLKIRQPAEDIEKWDDGDFLMDGEELTLRSASTTTAPSRRRDSNSSYLSLRSDLESWQGDEEQQVHIPGDDEKSTLDAIAAAEDAGIPLPKNVPSSALMGGTIKRLGGRKVQKPVQEDWENDLEMPDAAQGLMIRTQDQSRFPDSLRQVSGGSLPTSPEQHPGQGATNSISQEMTNTVRLTSSALSKAMNLDKFRDSEDDDDLAFGDDGVDTIRVSKQRQRPQHVSFITPPTPQKTIKYKQPEEDFEVGLELPSDGKLTLPMKRDIPKTPPSQLDDLDWGEGSLGIRYGGTRRDGQSSHRSSSASALSPSIASSMTAESEDETFEGLVLPDGPVNFQERLQKRRRSRSPHHPDNAAASSRAASSVSEQHRSKKAAALPDTEQAELLEGLDIGDVFTSGKLNLHRNIVLRETQVASPSRPKTAVSLTFTNKPASPSGRHSRLTHDRTHSTSLEPVSESGDPITQSPPARPRRRPPSRLGHSAQSSASSIPGPSVPSPKQSTTLATSARRRDVGPKTSMSTLRQEPTTTSAQLLKQKRSLPGIRAVNPPVRPMSFRGERPASRSDAVRPTTPVERRSSITDTPTSLPRRTHLPFLPAGASNTQSQHVASKTLRHFRRHDSDNSIDMRPKSRTISRSGLRSPSPQRYKVAADTWERLSRPKNKRHFGDGHELDAFDDLPTSKETENKYTKQPARGNSRAAVRPKTTHQVVPDRDSTPTPPTPQALPRPLSTPRFARDTAASRIARETALAQRAPSSATATQLASQRITQLSARTPAPFTPISPQPNVRSRKHPKRHQQSKPHLISNLNQGKESKVLNGMFYNAETFCWEGNENALHAFDTPGPTPTAAAQSIPREKTPNPRPALITNISGTQGVQVVGGMMFDPQNMCWLKIGPGSARRSEASDTMDGFDAFDEDEDVFKDIPNLVESTGGDDKSRHGRVSEIKDDWLVGEEFDVGPEFIRRQREEEERWRRKCEKWASRGPRDRDTWRWTIRELVSQFDDLPL